MGEVALLIPDWHMAIPVSYLQGTASKDSGLVHIYIPV